jgi:AcrR family transcriptional regulator
VCAESCAHAGWKDEVEEKLTFVFYAFAMKRNARKRNSLAGRRKPTQKRAQITVEAMLDAAVKLLKRGGVSFITTNRIAETAGVSIGSVYQYFPNKHALFAALHDRHIHEVDEILRRRMSEQAESSLGDLVRSWMDGMMEAHARDPELSELLQSEVPQRTGETAEFSIRLHGDFRAALAPHARELKRTIDLDIRAFVAANLVEALGHAVLFRRPRGLSLKQAKSECCQAILAYFTA